MMFSHSCPGLEINSLVKGQLEKDLIQWKLQ